MNVLLGVTGSVAAKLTPRLVEGLKIAGHEVRVVVTPSSLYFFYDKDSAVPVLQEKDEWPGTAYVAAQDIPHISLRNWADVLVVAPLSANTLAKAAHGLCDNLLTSVLRAWDLNKPVVVAPAMNTNMWTHPATAEHLATLGRWYRLTVVPPVEKLLACGDTGIGAMADIATIVAAVNGMQ